MTWPIVPFQDLYAIPSRNGLTRPKRVRGVGYKMVNMGELFAHGRIHDIAMERVPMNETEIDKFSLDAGDLLFARQSLIREGAGKCSIVMHLPEITCFESHIIRTRLNLDKAHPLFYYYYFSSSQGHGNVQSLVNQVAAAGIRGSELATLKIPLPPLPVQRKIAAILSAYDDLIENNRRRISILEEMARNLYREWFVKFRFPLFRDDGTIERIHDPERDPMQDSPLGPIPHGWEPLVLGDWCHEERKSVNPKEMPEDTVYIGLEHLPRRSTTLSDWGNLNGVASTKLLFKQGDILFGKIRPYFHKVGNALVDGVCSTDAIVIVPEGVPCARSVVLSCASSDEFVAHATQTSQGTKMPRANWKVMTRYPCPKPNTHVLRAFDSLIEPTIEECRGLGLKSRVLQRTRDHLLPKLISGQVDVSGLDIELPGEIIS